MNNLRKEFIKEIIETLKIPSGAFNIGTIADEIKHISDTDLRDFHKTLFGTSHSYLNGMDRIIKVAEQFKPVIIDEVEAKAKLLIDMVRSMNDNVFQEAQKRGVPFEDLLPLAEFKISDEDRAILNQVKPHCDLKQLISNINTYSTSIDCLNAFKSAINQSERIGGAIENNVVRKMIGSTDAR